MDDLEPGDYLYQSDQELFLIVVGETDDTYLFAAHGWRNIDKDRLGEYVEDTRSKVHRQDEIESVVEEQGDEKTKQQFNKLKQLFSVYEKADISEDGPHSEFSLDDT